MDQQVLFLVDSGSTHNFVSSKATNWVHLQPNSSGKLEVLIASGEKLVNPSRCAQVQVRLQKVPFEIDFFILPLESFDVLLGT